MSINNKQIEKLNSKNYQVAINVLKKDIIKKTSLSNNDILLVLGLSNKLIASDFLVLQPKFSQSNLLAIEDFINKNLNHKNKLFVSDLIEFAIDFNLDLNYKKCIALLRKYKFDNHYVLMSSMEYLFSNIKTSYISEIISSFILIMNNVEVDTSARLKASFYLFRITYKKEYLLRLKKIIGSDTYNKDILLNLLNADLNSIKYFDGHKEIRKQILDR